MGVAQVEDEVKGRERGRQTKQAEMVKVNNIYIISGSIATIYSLPLGAINQNEQKMRNFKWNYTVSIMKNLITAPSHFEICTCLIHTYISCHIAVSHFLLINCS